MTNQISCRQDNGVQVFNGDYCQEDKEFDVVIKQDAPTTHDPVPGTESITIVEHSFFPFANGIADSLTGDDQRKFISYIEDSAQMYLKVCTGNSLIYGLIRIVIKD